MTKRAIAVLRDAAGSSSAPERDAVYRQLLNEIIENQLAPGARLIEGSIALRAGVSRTPVREALLQLEREGFVAGERHHGFRVAALDEQMAREIFPMIGALQALAVSESGPLIVSQLESLTVANEQMQRSSTSRDAMSADSEFHRILIGLCPNAKLLALIETLHHQVARYERMYMSDATLVDISFAQHSEIVAAIAKGDTAGAERAVRANYASGLAAVISKLRMV